VGEKYLLQIYGHSCIDLHSMKANSLLEGYVISVKQFLIHFEVNYTSCVHVLLESAIFLTKNTTQTFLTKKTTEMYIYLCTALLLIYY
jgi:hypothetical protein